MADPSAPALTIASMLISSSFLAAVHGDGVSVSVGGLILGLLLGALVYLIAAWLAAESGQPIIRIVGAVLAIIVFIVLGFDFYE